MLCSAQHKYQTLDSTQVGVTNTVRAILFWFVLKTKVNQFSASDCDKPIRSKTLYPGKKLKDRLIIYSTGTKWFIELFHPVFMYTLHYGYEDKTYRVKCVSNLLISSKWFDQGHVMKCYSNKWIMTDPPPAGCKLAIFVHLICDWVGYRLNIQSLAVLDRYFSCFDYCRFARWRILWGGLLFKVDCCFSW